MPMPLLPLVQLLVCLTSCSARTVEIYLRLDTKTPSIVPQSHDIERVLSSTKMHGWFLETTNGLKTVMTNSSQNCQLEISTKTQGFDLPVLIEGREHYSVHCEFPFKKVKSYFYMLKSATVGYSDFADVTACHAMKDIQETVELQDQLLIAQLDNADQYPKPRDLLYLGHLSKEKAFQQHRKDVQIKVHAPIKHYKPKFKIVAIHPMIVLHFDRYACTACSEPAVMQHGKCGHQLESVDLPLLLIDHDVEDETLYQAVECFQEPKDLKQVPQNVSFSITQDLPSKVVDTTYVNEPVPKDAQYYHTKCYSEWHDRPLNYGRIVQDHLFQFNSNGHFEQNDLL